MMGESRAYCILRKMRKLCTHWMCQCAIYAQDCISFPDVQYMRKIYARLYFFSLMRNICTRFAQDYTSFSNAQDLRKIAVISPMRNIYAQDLCKIVLISQMRNICARLYLFCNAQYMRKICARFAQDCTYFSNAQYMCKICARLYLFPHCAIYGQDLHKIVLISARLYFFLNAQYMCNICARLQLFLQCARFAQGCTYVLIW